MLLVSLNLSEQNPLCDYVGWAQHLLAKFSCHLPRLPLTKKVITDVYTYCYKLYHSKFKAQAQKKSQSTR